MPLIPKRTAEEKTRVRLTATVTKANYKTLRDYAQFLGEDVSTKAAEREAVDLIINGAIELLAKDREFVAAQKPAAAAKRTAKQDTAA